MRSPRFAAVTFHLACPEPVSIGDPLREDTVARMAPSTTGTGEADRVPDVPATVDPFGEPLVRGTSLAGALREHLTAYELVGAREITESSIHSRMATSQSRVRTTTLADLLCGSLPEEVAAAAPAAQTPPRQRAPSLAPSALRVVSVETTGGSLAPARTRVAINRARGAAEPTKLYARGQVLDLELDVVLQVDLTILAKRCADLWGPAGEEGRERVAVEDFTTAILAWKPVIGGMRTTGHGGAVVSQIRSGVADPLPLSTLLQSSSTVALTAGVADAAATESPLVLSRVRAGRLTAPWSLQVPMSASDPLLVAPIDADLGIRKNHAVTADVIFGATWKGVLRSRCEFILRSCARSACESSTSTCGVCPTCVLFGSASDQGSGQIGRVRFKDSSITGEKMTLSHAPIDRFTAGAANGKLFTRTAWEPGALVTLSIEQARPDHLVPPWGEALLVLALRDLNAGLIGVGNSTTRGYGTLEVLSPLPPPVPNWIDTLPPEPEQVDERTRA